MTAAPLRFTDCHDARRAPSPGAPLTSVWCEHELVQRPSMLTCMLWAMAASPSPRHAAGSPASSGSDCGVLRTRRLRTTARPARRGGTLVPSRRNRRSATPRESALELAAAGRAQRRPPRASTPARASRRAGCGAISCCATATRAACTCTSGRECTIGAKPLACGVDLVVADNDAVWARSPLAVLRELRDEDLVASRGNMPGAVAAEWGAALNGPCSCAPTGDAYGPLECGAAERRGQRGVHSPANAAEPRPVWWSSATPGVRIGYNRSRNSGSPRVTLTSDGDALVSGRDRHTRARAICCAGTRFRRRVACGAGTASSRSDARSCLSHDAVLHQPARK